MTQNKYTEYLPNALNLRSHSNMIPAHISDKQKLARDGVHPGLLPHEMFAKALIGQLKGNKNTDPVLDILKIGHHG